MTERRVLVTGASGLLGTKLVEDLRARRWLVRCLIHRRAVPAADEQAAGSLEDIPSLERAVEGTEAIVHLAAVTHARRAEAYERANAEGTRNLVAVASRLGTGRFVLVSTRAVSPDGGAYSRSKARAEAAVTASGLPFVIVRLPELYGTGGNEGVERIIALVRRNARVPVVGGDEEICPLHVDDAVAACAGALDRPDCLGRTFTLAGDCMSILGFVESAKATFGSRSRVVSIPLPVMRAMSIAARVAPLPVYPDQLARLQAPKPPRSDDAPALLGFSPTPLAEGLRRIVPAGAQ